VCRSACVDPIDLLLIAGAFSPLCETTHAVLGARPAVGVCPARSVCVRARVCGLHAGGFLAYQCFAFVGAAQHDGTLLCVVASSDNTRGQLFFSLLKIAFTHAVAAMPPFGSTLYVVRK